MNAQNSNYSTTLEQDQQRLVELVQQSGQDQLRQIEIEQQLTALRKQELRLQKEIARQRALQSTDRE